MKKRTTGDILLDIEPLILELVEKQGLQTGDVLALIYGYLLIHCPGAMEEYEDGSNPIYYYGVKK